MRFALTSCACGRSAKLLAQCFTRLLEVRNIRYRYPSLRCCPESGRGSVVVVAGTNREVKRALEIRKATRCERDLPRSRSAFPRDFCEPKAWSLRQLSIRPGFVLLCEIWKLCMALSSPTSSEIGSKYHLSLRINSTSMHRPGSCRRLAMRRYFTKSMTTSATESLMGSCNHGGLLSPTGYDQ
jgi:hypothetical protein